MEEFGAITSLHWKADPPQERTYLICGAPRGGTSMIAGIVQRLGIHLGDFQSVRHEDEEMSLFFLEKQGLGIPELREAIQRRNAANAVWGWKDPIAIRHLRDIAHDIRNLHMILVARDPVAVCVRFADVSTAIKRTLNLYLRALRFANEREIPIALISYERAINNPERFVGDLCARLGVDRPENLDDIMSFIQPGEYQFPYPDN